MELRDDADPFWRNINLVAHNGRVEAEISDNVHHFQVSVFHDGTRVTDVTGQAIRIPWVTCPGAILLLRELVGAPVADAGRAPLDQTQQCTHMLDLARLAIAQANRGGSRFYECRIDHDPDRHVVVATLDRDGRLFVEWQVKDGRVISPGPFQGHETQGRSAWSDEVSADPDLREAGLIMRRASFIHRSRKYSGPRRSASEAPKLTGACYSYQPERASLAVRPEGFREQPCAKPCQTVSSINPDVLWPTRHSSPTAGP